MFRSYNRACSFGSVILVMAKGKRKRVSPEPTKKRRRLLPDLNQPALPDLNYPPPLYYFSDDEEQSLFVVEKNEVVWIGDEGSTTGFTSRKAERIEENESESSYNWIKGYWKKVCKWMLLRNKKDTSSC
ncbi:hypothetical protein Fmac_010641 [Flemingia macrophylla]|uniref:Uncharacterized protein n=1 Tax=Flemingia macrophylla TaxID=520843 RepID=A0ABD1MK62_9FABA